LDRFSCIYKPALQADFDVFNALTLMDNVDFLKELKVTIPSSYETQRSTDYFPHQFGSGDGHLNYYLYNWRTAPIAGQSSVGGVPAGRGVGVVML
jgi:glycylpeptide N-tetradecanoyltransferase